jgi:endonuclease-3
MAKFSHDIDVMISRIREAVKPYPKAALFELAEEGYATPFEQLVACIISIRTLDEVTLPTARRLFSKARTPAAIGRLTVQEIDELIHASSFHDRKAVQIQALARRQKSTEELPCDVRS